MSVPDAAIEIIEHFEGLRLKAYQCPAGVWTCGVGHTGPDVVEGLVVSEDVAEEWLRLDLESADEAIDRLVVVPINTNQRAALLSLIFNIGQGAFAKSTLLDCLNDGDYDTAALQFLRWDKAGGKAVNGLTRRRVAESALFVAEV